MARLVVNMRDSRPLWSIPDWGVEEIRRAASPRYEVEVVAEAADGRGDGGAASPAALRAIAGAEIYLGFGFPRPLFEAARRSGDALRWVHSGSAGIGGALNPEMVESTILLTNSAGIHAEPMADSVIAAILYFARGLDFASHGMHQRRWHRDPFDRLDTPVHEIEGSTLGIIGFGGIGRAVAARAAALGMRVIAIRRRPLPTPPGVELVTGEHRLSRLLTESRYIVLAVPRTAETETLLDRSRIETLRRDAVVINVGRGELVDETALADALAAGQLRGAALDVYQREPLPEDSRLWDLSNTLLTPHVSATTDRFWRREIDLILENLRRYERHEPLLNVVDKRAGY
jgi:phosphoglycerate dehydrogenase-like enzyme